MKTKNIYRSIYDHIEIPIFLVDVDAKGDFTYLGCNPAYECATNLKIKDLEGKHPEEIPGISVEEAAVLLEKFKTCLAQGEAITYEEKLVRHEVLSWWAIQLSPMMDEEGKITHLIGSRTNITEKKRAEEALRESELRYREIFENVSDCLFLLEVTEDRRFRNIEMNPAFEKAVGIPPSQMIGKYIEETVPEETAQRVIAKYQTCVEAGTAIESEVELALPTGLRTFQSTIMPVRNAHGRIHRLVGISRDVTEHKQTEARIRYLTRLYATLSQVNQTIVRVKDATTLFERVCAVAVEYGQFPLAWIGLFDEATARINPATHAGDEEGYQRYAGDNAEGSFDDAIDSAIHSGKVIVLQGPQTGYRQQFDPAPGYPSFAAIPFGIRGKGIGVLNLYATEMDFFSQEELALLNEISIDISFALEAMEVERERKIAELGLRKQTRMNNAMFDQAITSFVLLDRDYKFIRVNDAWATPFGKKTEDFIGLRYPDLFPQDKNYWDTKNLLDRVIETKTPVQMVARPFEFVEQPEKESTYWDWILQPILDEQGEVEFLFFSAIDVTERKQAETALALKEMELRNLAESSPGLMGMFYLRSDGTVCMPYVSPSIGDLFGLRPEDVIDDASPLLARTHPDDAQMVNETIAESARSLTPWHLEYRVLHPTRGELWLEGSTSPKPHPNGGIIWYGFVHDITSRKRAEQELRASEARFRTLVDHATDAFFLHDEQGIVLDVNQQACESLGYTREELIGMSPSEFDAALDLTTMEQIPARMAAGEVFVFDTLHRRKDGTVFPVEVRARSFGQGGHNLSISLARDMTERKRAETDVQRSNDLLRAIIEATPTAIIGLDLDGCVQTVWNPAAEKMLGWSAQEVMGRPLPTIPAERQEEFRQIRDQIRKGLTLNGVEVRRQKRDGTPIDYSIYASPLYDAQQQIVGNIAVLVDITERKQAEALLHKREQEFRALVENSPDYIGRYDRDARLVYANPAVVKMSGGPLSAITGKTPIELSPGIKEAQDIFDKLKKTLETGLSLETEIIIENTPEKGTVCHNARFVPEFDQDGQVASILFVGRDITENKQAEQALREAHQKYVVLVNSIDGIVWECDVQTFQFTFVSQQAERLLGYPAERWLAESTFWRDHIHPDDQEWAVNYCVACTLAKRPHEFEYRMLAADGHILWIRDIVTVVVEHDQPVRLRGIMMDNTQRRQAELERQAYLQFLESMDQVNRTMQGTAHLEQMMRDVLDAVLSIFDCDRAWLIYPCDPEASAWQALIERTRPEYPGALTLRLEVPMDPDVVRVFRTVRNTEGPVKFGPGSEHPLPVETAKRFNIQSQMAMAVYPKIELPWMFGMHQCAYPRDWTPKEERLFQEIGRRLTDSLTSLIAYRDLRAKTQELEALFSLSAYLRTAQTEDDILRLASEAVKRELEADASTIILLDPAKKQFTIALADGLLATNTGRVFPADQGISATVFQTRQPYFLNDYQSDPNSLPGTSGVEAYGHGVFVPLQSEGHFLGVLVAARKKSPAAQPFTEAAARLLITMGEMIGNSLQRMHLYEQALTRLNHLQTLQTIDTTILSSMDQNLTLGIIVNEVIGKTGIDAAAILLLDPSSFTLIYAAGQGFRTTIVQETHLYLGKGHAGQVAFERRPLSILNLAEIQEPFEEQLAREEGFVTYYAVPMITKGKVSGVLEVYHRSPLEIPGELENFLKALGNQAAIAIDNAQLFEDLQRSNLELVMAYDQTIEGWSRALDLRDKETEGHTQRVTDLTLRLARAMGISGEPLMHIRRGSLLHDIGKMGIPDPILLKPGELTEEEWEIMRKHPTYAYELLYPIHYLRPALDIPYCHHEKWDGTGYPRGLKEEQIPQAARIFAIVDVWDALRSDRPYRPGWPVEKVREHIRSLSGSNFDPGIVQAFLRLIT